jgi:hypothetical protein
LTVQTNPEAREDDDPSGHPGEPQTQLPKDVIFGLLSAERRRHVLQYLADNDGYTTLSDLAEYIAAKENDTEIRLLTSQQRKRVYVGLYQCHLPKLDDSDVIDFDQSRGTVQRRPNADLLCPYLDIDPRATAGDSPEQSDENATLREKLSTYLS